MRAALLVALLAAGALAGCAVTEVLRPGGETVRRSMSFGPLILPRPAGDLAVTWAAAGLVLGPLPEARLGLSHGVAVYGLCASIMDGRPAWGALSIHPNPMEELP
jgi:hypothetical protein